MPGTTHARAVNTPTLHTAAPTVKSTLKGRHTRHESASKTTRSKYKQAGAQAATAQSQEKAGGRRTGILLAQGGQGTQHGQQG